MIVDNFLKSVRRSARLASRFRPDTATVEEVVGTPAVGSAVASASSRVPRRAVPEGIYL